MRKATDILRSLNTRLARLERKASYPPPNETSANRQAKISHLLRIVLDNTPTLSDIDRKFITAMGGLLNKRVGLEPATALSEKQARNLRRIIFGYYKDYKHAVPPLPSGVKFEDEVRRLLKSQANPNELRNEVIQEVELTLPSIVERFIKNELLINAHNIRVAVSYVRTEGRGEESYAIFSVKYAYKNEEGYEGTLRGESGEFGVAVRVQPIQNIPRVLDALIYNGERDLYEFPLVSDTKSLLGDYSVLAGW